MASDLAVSIWVSISYVDLKPYFTKLFLNFVVKKAMDVGGKEESNITTNSVTETRESEVPAGVAEVDSIEEEKPQNVDVAVENIESDVETPKPQRQPTSEYTLVCIGEYPIKILAEHEHEGQQILIDKSSDEIRKWITDTYNSDDVLGLDASVETHFWHQILPYLTQNADLITRLKNRLLDNKYGVLTVSSSWDGIGSALMPTLISCTKEWNMNSVTIALLPSKLQPSEAHFNAFSSLGSCVSKENATLILLGRDQLNKYVGVERKGAVMKGNVFLDCLAEIALAKTTFVRELCEMSSSFGVKAFTVMAATGASFKIFGSLENILDSTLFRPLLSFNLSSALLLYVLLRIPMHLKEVLGRDKVELEIAHWFKEKAVLKSIHVTEPIYVEEVNDRVDLIMIVGGFDLASVFFPMEKKIDAIKAQATKQGSIKEEEWKEIKKGLMG